jgi:hypothetical protein
MFVQTSTDNGATFGAPQLITPAGGAAFLDLQCADSGGPSSLTVNPTTGQLYAVFGTRSSPAGGCGATVTDGAEINIVRATRVWVATSPDNSPGSWRTSLAVDDSAAQHIVGLQLSYGALDRAGNVYVAYPESKTSDDLTSSVMLVHAPPDLASWSKPVTVASMGAGHALVHLVAGDPGRVALAYFAADGTSDGVPLWYSTVAQSLDATSASPHFTEVRLADKPAFKGTVNIMEGRCTTNAGPAAGVIDGFGCPRFSDVYGMALDHAGRTIVAWPGLAGTPGVLAGVWVSTQVGGPTLFTSGVSGTDASTAAPSPRVKPQIPATGGGAGPWVPFALLAGYVSLRAWARRSRPSTSHGARMAMFT